MNRSVVPKIRIPTVEEVDSVASSDHATIAKKGAFTRLRETETTSSFISSASTAEDADSISAVKRKRQEEYGDTVENGIVSEDGSSSLGDCRKITTEPRPSGSTIIVCSRQKGNPLLRFLRNVPYEFGQTSADYVLSESRCALFLSLKFHKLHPDYVHERLKEVGRAYALQILLVQIDIPEPEQALRELNTICFNANWTFLLAWSPEEAAELLESYKIYENKPPDFLMGRQETDPRAKMVDLLTTIKSITRTDAENLITTFGSLKNMVEASEEQLALSPGLGPKKAKRLYYAFGASWLYEEKHILENIPSVSNPDFGEGTSDVSLVQKSTEIDPDDLFEGE